MDEPSVSETLERLSNLLRTDVRRRALPHGLRPVHVEALLYLARCNRYSDTPQAVTEYLGSTKGTVSQTLKVLERKELLTKRSDPEDRRVARLQLTSTGRELARDLAESRAIAETLAESSVPPETLARDLRLLLAGMQKAAGYRTFGVCHTCRFFRREEPGYRCGLTAEPLSVADATRICREHERVEG